VYVPVRTYQRLPLAEQLDYYNYDYDYYYYYYYYYYYHDLGYCDN